MAMAYSMTALLRRSGIAQRKNANGRREIGSKWEPGMLHMRQRCWQAALSRGVEFSDKRAIFGPQLVEITRATIGTIRVMAEREADEKFTGLGDAEDKGRAP
jgi:hypothetical protein